MKLKTFAAPNLQEALSMVKKELGEDAVILSTEKKVLGDGNGGRRRRAGIEVTAAIDPDPTLISSRATEDDGAWEIRRPRQARSRRSLADDAWSSRFETEFNDLKDLLLQMVRNTAPPHWLQGHPELAVFYRFLLRTGADVGFLTAWLQDIQGKMTQGDENGRGWQNLALAPVMEACEVVNPFSGEDAGMQVWTVIGPTGVGKTTTLAKLAAHYALNQKKKVALISLDTYRLGAQGQIEAFARIAGLPLSHVANRTELVAALKKFQQSNLVLIDTTGRSPHHPGLDVELQSTFGGLPGLHHHVVLSATAKEDDLEAALKSFGRLGVASLMVTKLDETKDFSGVFNVLRRHRTPVSFLTTGQRVPEDLEFASKRRLAELLLHSGRGVKLGGEKVIV